MCNAGLSLSTSDLAQVVRNGLRLSPATDVAVSEVTRWTNLNYVFRATVDGSSIYLKAVAASPKHLPITLPKERIVYEARAIGLFRGLCGPTVLMPEVLFVDHENFVLGMTDVGEGRDVLLEVIDDRYPMLVEQAVPLGYAMGKIHGGSRGSPSFRPYDQDCMLRSIIFEGLLAPGAKALFPERWPDITKQMNDHRECFVHSDLWGKNLLVSEDAVPSIVDFEGASIGDPALDVATLLAVGLIPALQEPSLNAPCVEFSRRLIDAYRDATGDRDWSAAVCARAYLYAGTCLAARGFGPFAYDMPKEGRERPASCARTLSADPPRDLDAYCERLSAYG